MKTGRTRIVRASGCWQPVADPPPNSQPLWLTSSEIELLVTLSVASLYREDPAELALFAKLGDCYRAFRHRELP